MLYYIYNGDELIGFKYNDNIYYYHKNILGDIIGILDSNYNEIVCYEYDSWGNIINIQDNSSINLGNINPFKYHSYYYDLETGLYYINSRYYNPRFKRFINIDSSIITYYNMNCNLYCYCTNCPINKIDKDGKISEYVIALLAKAVIPGLISALISVVFQIISNILDKNRWFDGIIYAAIWGFIDGFAGNIFGLSWDIFNFIPTVIEEIEECVKGEQTLGETMTDINIELVDIAFKECLNIKLKNGKNAKDVIEQGGKIIKETFNLAKENNRNNSGKNKGTAIPVGGVVDQFQEQGKKYQEAKAEWNRITSGIINNNKKRYGLI